ncbi:MAG: 30S ribosomal protein S15 [Candidatus Aenigmarchaeota archaeon]|nr:30S ribosomal protein S15 [Candidatus Aenigmarchaeota archaeon]
MAKMHSRKKGTSGSKKPLKKVKPTWIRYKPKEIEMLVTKLAKEGQTASMIGITLRDSYGIPDVQLLAGKSVTSILAEKKILPKLPEDMVALMKKALAVKKHLETNKHDMSALRGLQLTESKIKRNIKYYKAIKKIPIDFKYEPDNLKMYTE